MSRIDKSIGGKCISGSWGRRGGIIRFLSRGMKMFNLIIVALCKYTKKKTKKTTQHIGLYIYFTGELYGWNVSYISIKLFKKIKHKTGMARNRLRFVGL